MRTSTWRLSALLIAALVVPAFADDTKDKAPENEQAKMEQKRAELDKMARETLNELREKHPKAKELYDDAYGYAVFRSLEIAIGVTGGSGNGVAIPKDSNEHIYMKMATGGIGVGLGGQKHRTVFLFEDKETFDQFVYKGWEADAEASASAGTEGKHAASSFTEGIAIYQFTDKGLLATADVSGTKYWINEKLNPREEDSD